MNEKTLVRVFLDSGLQIGIVSSENADTIENMFLMSNSKWVIVEGVNQLGDPSHVRVLRDKVVTFIIEDYKPQLVQPVNAAPKGPGLVRM